MIVSGYQFCITLGLLLASCVVYGTQDFKDSRSYRVPIGIQWLWALILCEFTFNARQQTVHLISAIAKLYLI